MNRRFSRDFSKSPKSYDIITEMPTGTMLRYSQENGPLAAQLIVMFAAVTKHHVTKSVIWAMVPEDLSPSQPGGMTSGGHLQARCQEGERSHCKGEVEKANWKQG